MDDQMAAAQAFMAAPLVRWALYFKRPTTECRNIEDLASGIFINEFLADMDNAYFARNETFIKPDAVANPRSRRSNLGLALETLTTYFQDELKLLIVHELPVIDAIACDPFSATAIESLRRLLLLLLGASVKCERRETYVLHIQGMEKDGQIEMMQILQDFLNKSVLPTLPEDIDTLDIEEIAEQYQKTYVTLFEAVSCRDDYACKYEAAIRERDFVQSQLTELMNEPSTPQDRKADLDLSHSARHFETVRELKSQLRKVTEELDQKSAYIDELLTKDAAQTRTNSELSAKVRQLSLAADENKSLKDELDIYRDKAIETERFKAEIERYRQLLQDFDYTKKRVDELSEQNDLLAEQNSNLKSAQSNNDELRDTIERLIRESRVHTAQNDELKKYLNENHAKIRDLHSSLVTAETDKAHALREVDRLKSELRALEEKATAEKQLDALSSIKDTVSRTEYLRVETENSQLRNRINKAEKASARAEELEDKNAKLELEREHASEQIHELENLIDSERDKAAALNRRVVELEDELTKVREQVKTPMKSSLEQQRIQAIEQKLENALNKSVDLKEERIKVLEERLQDLLTQNAQLKQDLKVMNKHMDLSRPGYMGSPAMRGGSSPLVRAAQGSPAGSVSSKDTPQKSSTDFSMAEAVELSIARDEIENLRKENQSLQEMINADQSQAKSKAAMYSERNETLHRMNTIMTRELEQAHLDLRQAENDKNKANERLRGVQDRLQVLAKSREGLEAENKKLMKQVQDLLQQNQDLLFRAMEHPHPVQTPAPSIAEDAQSITSASSAAAGGAPPPKEEPKRRRSMFGGRLKNIGNRVERKKSRASISGSSENLAPAPFNGGDMLTIKESKAKSRTIEPLSPPPHESRLQHLSRNSDPQLSPMSEKVGIEEMLMEGKLETAIKSPAHLPKRARDVVRGSQFDYDTVGDNRDTINDFLLKLYQDQEAQQQHSPQHPGVRRTSLHMERLNSLSRLPSSHVQQHTGKAAGGSPASNTSPLSMHSIGGPAGVSSLSTPLAASMNASSAARSSRLPDSTPLSDSEANSSVRGPSESSWHELGSV